MSMHFETAGSARTPADEPTTAGRLHRGVDARLGEAMVVACRLKQDAPR